MRIRDSPLVPSHQLTRRSKMQLLGQHGIDRIYHFAPLHYLPFIAQDRQLKSKPVLELDGFAKSHFRSTSGHIDIQRGFRNYVHLSTHSEPPILRAKLRAGFPHFGLELRTSDFTEMPHDLCRFNIAKTRQLRRDGKPGFRESDANGRYYDGLQIPIARSQHEKDRMLSVRKGDPMIEVLINERVHLNGTVNLLTYCEEDQGIAQSVLECLGVNWAVTASDISCPYDRSAVYAASVEDFIEKALSDRTWRGNGLEFDQV